MSVLRTGLAGFLLAVAPLAQTASGPDVRIRILDREAPSEVRVEATEGPIRIVADGIERATAQRGEVVTLTRSNGDVRARFGGADVSARSLRLNAEGFRLRAGRVDRQYPGALAARVAGGRLELVNHAPIEPYVASVVQSEFGFPVLEGAKAQAVLARTYALRRAGDHPTYDVEDDHRSQVYRGLSGTSDVSRRAAYETAGEVLTYFGTLADATYFSSSGGHTADNDKVWAGDPIPYLRGVPDPYDDASPDHTWRTTAARSAVHGALTRQYGGRVEGVEVLRRSRSNRVLEIRLVGGRRSTITGADFRRVVNAAIGARTVRSTRFTVRAEGDRYVFDGGGYGHGVGLSQYGALGQARAGRDYRQILSFYFAGTAVTPTGDPLAPPALVASVNGPEAGVPAAAIPREPASALRTRYRPVTARRWPTPRHVARQQAADADAAPMPPIPPRPPATPAPEEAPQARRTAW